MCMYLTRIASVTTKGEKGIRRRMIDKRGELLGAERRERRKGRTKEKRREKREERYLANFSHNYLLLCMSPHYPILCSSVRNKRG